MASSPIYKNLKSKKIQSPIHLKEKIRKDYKNKVQNCRDMLLNRFRGSPSGNDLRTTLTDIYNDTVNKFHNEGFEIEHLSDNEEAKILEEIKMELINNEIDWWLEEYDKSQTDNTDWSSIHRDENIICLLCQKNNFTFDNNTLSCKSCKISIKTEMSLPDIKEHVNRILERHSSVCNNMVQFTAVSESNMSIYFICESCMDMQLIL